MAMDATREYEVRSGDRYRHSFNQMLVIVTDVEADGLVCFMHEDGRPTRLSPLLLQTFLRDFTRLPAEHP